MIRSFLWENIKQPASTWDEVVAVPPKLIVSNSTLETNPLLQAYNGASGLTYFEESVFRQFSGQLLGGLHQNAPGGAFSQGITQ